MTRERSHAGCPKWQKIEFSFTTSAVYPDPVRQIELKACFVSPSGRSCMVDGFWDGENVWKIRFAPDEEGDWSYTTICSELSDVALHGQPGHFSCGPAERGTRFSRHGPLQLSKNRRFFIHADGTPFFWLADTAWNGPLLATSAEWGHYLIERVRQKFNTVQCVTTQWLAAPRGDRNGSVPFTGMDRIVIDPTFFQRLDEQFAAIAEAGLLNAPVLLWAATWSTPEANAENPGTFLPEDQAVLLARYMVARWSAEPVVWILAGDGDYRGERAERWKRIGRAVFADRPHAPVLIHPAGMEWNGRDFQHEKWLDALGYQSGHGDNQEALAWLVAGPVSADWKTLPARPIINLEPPYEDHLAHHSGRRIDADFVRRALYWSLLNAPTAGVSYGGHGVWAWDDGVHLTPGHFHAGLPKSWRQALLLPGAEQIHFIAEVFESIEWWRLEPAPELLAEQPGHIDRNYFMAAAKSADDKLIIVYTPMAGRIVLNINAPTLSNRISTWFNPRDGRRAQALPSAGERVTFTTPAVGDWLLVITALPSLSP